MSFLDTLIYSYSWTNTKGIFLVLINAGILLANPERSLYCTILRYLVDAAKINNKTCMAGECVRLDVCSEACFYQFATKTIYVVYNR